MSDGRIDFMTQFEAISNKIKRKGILIKKPNYNEAFQQFESLGLSCEREDLPHYAGLCYQAAAKCQKTLGNDTEEAVLLLKASRQFMLAELNLVSRNVVSMDSYCHQAVTNYHECTDILKNLSNPSLPNMKVLLSGITLELGDALKNKLGRNSEAVAEYEKALIQLSDSPLERVQCLSRIITCHMDTGEFNEALKLTNEVVETCQKLSSGGVRTDILREAEVTRVLLLLILQPTPQQIPVAAATVLDKYAWVDTIGSTEVVDLRTTLANNNLSFLPERTFIGLQSLVMACQSNDQDCLIPLEDDLSPCLTHSQQDLLRILVKQMLNCDK